MKLSHLGAIVRTEIVWSIRKRKLQLLFLAVLAAATLTLVYPVLLSALGLPRSLLELITKEMPKVVLASPENWAYIVLFRIRGVLAVLFIFIAMDSIAGEFEQETITPLLAKPVSRKAFLLAKFVASMVMVAGVLLLSGMYSVAGSWLLYGQQAMIEQMPTLLLALTYIILPFIAIAVLLGVMTRSTVVTGVGTAMLYGFFGSSQSMIFKNLGMEDSRIAKALLGWSLDLPMYVASGSPNVLPAVGIVAAYTAVALAVSLLHFERADIVPR